MHLRFTLTAAAMLFALAQPARAEVIQLLDNTQVSGKIVHFYDGTFAIETSDGQKVELPTTKIKCDHLQAAARARRVLDAREDLRPLQGRAGQERHQQAHRLLRAHVPGRDGRRARPHHRRSAQEDAERDRRHQARDQVLQDHRQERHVEGRSAPRATRSRPPTCAWSSRTASGSSPRRPRAPPREMRCRPAALAVAAALLRRHRRCSPRPRAPASARSATTIASASSAASAATTTSAWRSRSGSASSPSTSTSRATRATATSRRSSTSTPGTSTTTRACSSRSSAGTATTTPARPPPWSRCLFSSYTTSRRPSCSASGRSSSWASTRTAAGRRRSCRCSGGRRRRATAGSSLRCCSRAASATKRTTSPKRVVGLIGYYRRHDDTDTVAHRLPAALRARDAGVAHRHRPAHVVRARR